MKNFITSTKQRNCILIAIIIAIISLTLPAFRAMGASESLFEDAYGSLMMFGLIFSGIIIFFREEFHAILNKKMEKNFSQDIVTFIALVPMIGVLWRLILLFIEANEIIGASKHLQMMSGFFGGQYYTIGITYGFYLTIFSVLFAIICIFAFASVEKVSDTVKTKISEVSEKNSENTEEKNSDKVLENSQEKIIENSEKIEKTETEISETEAKTEKK